MIRMRPNSRMGSAYDETMLRLRGDADIKYFKVPRTVRECIDLARAMQRDGFSYHPEDDLWDCFTDSKGQLTRPLITLKSLESAVQGMHQIFRAKDIDPCEIALLAWYEEDMQVVLDDLDKATRDGKTNEVNHLIERVNELCVSYSESSSQARELFK